MAIYEIAELKVLMNPKHNKLINQGEKYKINNSTKNDLFINISDEFIKEKQIKNPHLSLEDCEYIWFGSDFYNKLIEYNGMILHSSCVVVNNEAYLFSASCGVGKSTHTRLWQEYFGKDKAIILNDDKPAIRFIDNSFYAYGTPFSGKTNINENLKVKVKAIIFLKQSKENHINKMENKTIIESILGQTLRPIKKEKYIKLLQLIDKLINNIPFYKLSCNMTKDAVRLVYETIVEDENENIK